MRISLSIRLHNVCNIHTLLPSTTSSSDNEEEEDDNVVEAWLSYRLLDTVIQSKKFEMYPTRTQNFEANEDVFDLSAANRISSLSSPSFDVYLCTHGSLLGRTRVNIQRLLALDEGDGALTERAGKGTFYFTTEAADSGYEQDESSADASIEVSMSLKRELITSGNAYKLEPSTPSTTTSCCQTSPLRSAIPQHPNELLASTPDAMAAPAPAPVVAVPTQGAATTSTADDRIQFEKERRRWEEWRHKEEMKWHSKMREQESAALNALDEQSKAQERQNSKEIEAKKKEFEALEGRLRKALGEVEKRERRIRTVEASREAEYTTKMAEVELKQRLLKEESKHAAEIEVAKVRAANERVATAEKATAVAEERARAMETNFEAFKKAHRESHEGSLQQEISTLKGELVAAESRINKAIQEKNEADSEKEQHRANVHKLAKALKKEKLKVQALEDKERKQFLLERKRHCLEISNNREELMRITSQLQGIDSNAGAVGATGTSAGENSSINCSAPLKATLANSILSQKAQVPGPLPAPLTPPRHPWTKSAAVSTTCRSEDDSLRLAGGLGAMSLTPTAEVWNGTAINTTRHKASDSKLHLG